MRTGAFAQPNPCQTKRAAPCMATLFAPFFTLQPPIAMPTDCSTSRGLAKNVHVCVLIQHGEYPSNTATRLPGKTPSAGGRLLHPVRLKRKRKAFFEPARPLSRPRRCVNDTLQPSLFVLA